MGWREEWDGGEQGWVHPFNVILALIPPF